MDEQATRELLVELLGVFYAKGWVSGTGGGICGPADGGGLLLAPTGVHKERIRPDEFFTVDPADGRSVAAPRTPRPPSERVQRDLLAWPRGSAARGASSTPTRSSAVLAGDLAAADGADHLAIRDLEMLKGIRGVANRDTTSLPVIRNTPREAELDRAARRGSSTTRASRRRSRSSSPTTAPTSGARTSGRPSATPRSITSCSRRWSPDATDRRRPTR